MTWGGFKAVVLTKKKLQSYRHTDPSRQPTFEPQIQGQCSSSPCMRSTTVYLLILVSIIARAVFVLERGYRDNMNANDHHIHSLANACVFNRGQGH